jgi:NAD(P)-dependent dehydrogenase (short-subunit alcohol dehydrogenase family)
MITTSHRTALVTGVSSGIGEAIAARLLKEQWHVVGVSRRLPNLADRGLRWLEADLAEPGEAERVAEDVSKVGPVGAVVHAAGLMFTGRLGSLDASHGERMWRVHVDAPSRLIDALAGSLDEGARVVLIGSRTAVGVAGKSQYAATKSALAGLARSWAIELAARAITVNVVAPGPTATPMLDDPRRASTPPVAPPLGRFVQPAEIAGLTAFLLGPEGGSITGQQLVICGGASL